MLVERYNDSREDLKATRMRAMHLGGPNSYDCSGPTLAAWHAAGVGLPHNAARQYRSMTPVSRADARQGDLVFFYSPISHVGVYIGGGKMIHAPEYGENVRVSRIDIQPVHDFGRPS